MAKRSFLDSLLAHIARTHAGSVSRRFFRDLHRARRVQSRLMSQLVHRAAPSRFGRAHGFDRIRSYPDFVERIPIHTYADLSPYIEQLREGQVDALFAPGERILMFALTSGTTDQPKYIPITSSVLADCRRGWNVWGLQAILDHPASLLRHILQVTSSMHDHAAPSGVPCGAITGLLAATQKKLVRRYYTSPAAVAAINDPTAKYYTIMRLAMPRDVSWAVTANPATLLVLARIGDEHKERLIRDIRDGTLWADLPVPSAVRDALRPRLKADREAADRLGRIASRDGTLYPKDYWRMDFLAHWTGGTMGLYRSQFPKYFGEVPVRDIGLIASEGRMSLPIKDSTASGVLAISTQFFEFIPVGEYGTEKPSVLQMHELREGEAYFLLLTNGSGLFRYDIGDRVRVTGRLGETPLIEFLSRDAHTSSMAGEKLTEDQVVAAMESVCDGRLARAGADGEQIVDFVLAPRWGEVPCYRLYVEQAAAEQRPELAKEMDTALARMNNEYESKRQTLRLGPLELFVLPDGVITERDRELRRKRSRTSEQFKHQYLQGLPGMDQELEAAGRVHESARQT